ncbi:uncharacterized protein LOC106656419 [Trichogramma pretiosum]|uniref:uncharacterized protein LOC106656419 n=1 Tax=Trichogramma pretiosum TaxID=7493 RepID=UPI0006C9C0B8|nr:uncharacterized protein LOC106656419 [Trichogramma pretiosum]
MAGILRCSGNWNVNAIISVLIVAPGDLCDLIYEQLRASVKERGYRITIHKSESIDDILHFKPNLQVDFVVFAFNGRIAHQIHEVERNIGLLDEFFIISGRVCLVNCIGGSNGTDLNCHAAQKVREKYCVRLFSADVHKKEGLESIGSRVLCLAEALMGVHSGIVDLNVLTSL